MTHGIPKVVFPCISPKKGEIEFIDVEPAVTINHFAGGGLVVKRKPRSSVPGQKMEFKDGKRVA